MGGRGIEGEEVFFGCFWVFFFFLLFFCLLICFWDLLRFRSVILFSLNQTIHIFVSGKGARTPVTIISTCRDQVVGGCLRAN